MKRSFIVVVLVGFACVCAGCRQEPTKQAKAPPSVDELKEMISRAASIRVETFDQISGSPEFRSALRYSSDQPLTLMILDTRFVEAERDIIVELPEESAASRLSTATKLIVINVRENGQYVLGGWRLDLKGLRDTIAKAAGANPQQKVLIRCDHRALYRYFAAAVQICREVGIADANIGFDYGLAGRGVSAKDVTPPKREPDKTPHPDKPAPDVIPRPASAPAKDASSPEKARDFRSLGGDGLARADDLARAIRGRGKAGAEAGEAYVSIIRPEYITKCTRKVQGDTITGKVSYRAEGLYEGTVEYTAGRGPDGWRIEQFRLPVSGRQTVLTVRGTWMATPDPAWFRSAKGKK